MGLRRLLRDGRTAWALRRTRADGAGAPHRVEGVVFSKDRPLQLHALLASYAELVKDPPPLHVLYRASDERYRAAYDEVFRASPAPVEAVAERAFRDDLLALLDRVRAPRLFFLVDDIVFVRPVDFGPLLALDPARFVPALRLAPHLTRCYTFAREQPLPPFREGLLADPGLLCWRWRDGALDWAYPLSVDGNLFSTGEIRVLAQRTPFAAPNSFEAALQRHVRLFSGRLGVCHREARVVNVPCNKVQEEIDNRYGETDAETLLALWREGKQLDHRRLYGIVNESAHQDVPLSFVDRGAGQGATRG